MKRALVILACTIVWSFVAVGPSFGSFDAFLLIQGLQGESAVAGRTNWTNIQAVNWAHGVPPPGTSTTPSKALFQPLSVVKVTDSLSPVLALAAANGQPFPSAVIELTRVVVGNNVVFLKLELFDVRIVGYSAGGATQGAANIPSEELKLSYARIRWTAYKYSPTGQAIPPPSTGSWDLFNNKAF